MKEKRPKRHGRKRETGYCAFSGTGADHVLADLPDMVTNALVMPGER